MNKLSLVGMQLPEKYKENFDVSSECPCSIKLLTKPKAFGFARNVEILLITYVFRVVASLPTKQFQDIFNITDVFMYFNCLI